MIYTVTFNPAIDYIVHTDEMETGGVIRSSREEIYIGGKGLNVSQVLKELGKESEAFGFVAGFTGEAIERGMKNYGIADLPLHFEPKIAGKEDLQVELWKASEEGLNNGWIMKEPYRKLPRLQGIPILLMVSESSYHAGYDHLTSKVLEQSGVEHDFVRLENIGIHGNGHMMMLEKNNLEIAQWIAGWLEKKGE